MNYPQVVCVRARACVCVCEIGKGNSPGKTERYLSEGGNIKEFLIFSFTLLHFRATSGSFCISQSHPGTPHRECTCCRIWMHKSVLECSTPSSRTLSLGTGGRCPFHVRVPRVSSYSSPPRPESKHRAANIRNVAKSFLDRTEWWHLNNRNLDYLNEWMSVWMPLSIPERHRKHSNKIPFASWFITHK